MRLCPAHFTFAEFLGRRSFDPTLQLIAALQFDCSRPDQCSACVASSDPKVLRIFELVQGLFLNIFAGVEHLRGVSPSIRIKPTAARFSEMDVSVQSSLFGQLSESSHLAVSNRVDSWLKHGAHALRSLSLSTVAYSVPPR